MEKCVLIYDDERDMLHLCKEILKEKNYLVECLENCENILADIALFKPYLILMDLWIPGMGGEKAIALIKNHPDTQHIPVIIFSAVEGIEEICEKVHADGYLQKPFDISALRETIDSYIE